MNWQTRFLVVAVLAALFLVIVDQNSTITEQRSLIQSFAQDPSCMHDPRGR